MAIPKAHKVFKCPNCNKQVCIECREDHDSNVTCEQYKKWKEENDQEEKKFKELVNEEKL